MSFGYIAKKVTVKAYHARGGGWGWHIRDFYGEHIATSAKPLPTKRAARLAANAAKAEYLKVAAEKIAARKAGKQPL